MYETWIKNKYRAYLPSHVNKVKGFQIKIAEMNDKNNSKFQMGVTDYTPDFLQKNNALNSKLCKKKNKQNKKKNYTKIHRNACFYAFAIV